MGCSSAQEEPTLFEQLSTSETGIDFTNQLEYTMELNPYTYRNFFNGGGVGLADFNQDGLLDIYYTGNQVSNKLYLNQGNFEFKDITEQAGVAVEGVWSTGVSIADVNGDGWPDIYVCKSGSPGGENRHNELFINNGDLTFTERSEEWGLDVVGLTTDATFFDYDRDGDLDMYLLSSSFEAVGQSSMRNASRTIPDPEGGDRLFRNELIASDGAPSGKQFTEVTEQAGIYSSAIGFGLDVLVGDINKDGWPDIYVTNDYFERDYLYLNNQDGSFTEQLPQSMNSISLSSMGGDLADLTGDGRPEIYVTDMLPEPLSRQKSTTTFYSWDEYTERLNLGYHHQVVRNTLQLNRGALDLSAGDQSPTKTAGVHFSEIGRLAGVYATDWSWSALMADYDLDGGNDIYVTNGIYKDLTYQDYVNDRQSLKNMRSVVEGEMDVQQLFEDIPSTPVSNYVFAGNGEYSFTNKAEAWGLAEPGFSNGAAYGDLDNDGDLDLVVNNVNTRSSIYKNRAETEQPAKNWLMVKLMGQQYNTTATGAQVKVWTGEKMLYREQMPNRGYQSSVDPRLHFGLDNRSKIDSLQVIWPVGMDTMIYEPAINQQLVVEQSTGKKPDRNYKKELGTNNGQGELQHITAQVDIDFNHQENNFADFEREQLLFHMLSTQGPAACVADLNGDGLDDLYLGGAKDQPGSLFLQQEDLRFEKVEAELFEDERQSEDTDCTFFDAESDGDPDLYVASGGSEFPASSTAIADRLYINNGTRDWIKDEQALPAGIISPTATVQPADFDRDGDQDLFVGQRLKSFAYGMPVKGSLLVNDGQGNFTDQTDELAPALAEAAPITDSQWLDYDRDGDLDLLVAGEWAPIRLFSNQLAETGEASFEEYTQQTRLDSAKGWWQTVHVSDLNGDGYPDIIAGNKGRNTMFEASPSSPMALQVGDFDQNGISEQLTAITRNNEEIPLVLRQDLMRQLPSMKQSFPTYKAYSEANMQQLLSHAKGEPSMNREISALESSVFWNRRGKQFDRQALPMEAQFAPIYAVLADSSIQYSRKGHRLYIGGNLHGVKPQLGRYDASYGATIEVDSNEQFSVISHQRSGFTVEGEIRKILKLRSSNGLLYLVVRNDDTPVWFRKSNK